MNRKIVGFVNDEAGDWVAWLDCFHRQHVRHSPPFRIAPWVMDDTARSQRIGSVLDCPLCDRAELPDGLEVVSTSDIWNERTMPAGLRRAHRVASGRWARLRVEEGELHFLAQTEPKIETIVSAGASLAIPPEVEHEVEPCGSVRFWIEFLRPTGAAEASSSG